MTTTLLYCAGARPDQARDSRAHLRPQSRGGFSLVEVTLAIGIVAFAFVALFGLIPVGLTTFRQAMDTSTASQIYQRVISDAQEMDFDSLIKSAVEEKKGKADQFSVLPLRYFDDQGNELKVKDPENPTAAELQNMIYVVRTRMGQPGEPNPKTTRGERLVSLPSLGGSRFSPRDLTILSVQIANNPGRKDLSSMLDRSNTYLWVPSLTTPDKRVPVLTYSGVIARNGFTTPPRL